MNTGPTAKLEHEAPSFHRIRKRIHLLCVVIFIALPMTNLMRFDIPRQRFYFAGREIWISEFAILFFTMMFLMFVVAAGAMIWGRVYCGYLCPQMIFSEASIALQDRLRRFVNRRAIRLKPRTRDLLSRTLLYAVLAVASVVLSFAFIAYFVEPRDLVQRLLRFDVRTAGGIAGASVTLFTFLDFTFVRLRFCATVCPYGYLQGILSDDETLIVDYRDENEECIDCKKCVRDCPMGIDIRKSPYQIECIHCGECVDACAQVLGRLGKEGLIHYSWGRSGRHSGKAERWYSRLGIRNTKRFAVLVIALCYALGLTAMLSMRKTVVIRVSPDRSVLYRQASGGGIVNTFRLTATNRGSASVPLTLAIEQLAGGRFVPSPFPITLRPGETRETELDIQVAPSPRIVAGVHHFRIVARAANERQIFEQTFITPTTPSRSPQ